MIIAVPDLFTSVSRTVHDLYDERMVVMQNDKNLGQRSSSRVSLYEAPSRGQRLKLSSKSVNRWETSVSQ